MPDSNRIKIIGVDAGYGNMKTANFCFRTGLTAYGTEPLFTKNMLVYEGRYYLVGEGHKTYTAEKTLDEDYYILTLAAIAMELNREHLTEADVYLSAGLPLSWVLEQMHDYTPSFMRLYVVGGGGCLLRNFAKLDSSRVTFDDDICATAKGYEFLTEYHLRNG